MGAALVKEKRKFWAHLQTAAPSLGGEQWRGFSDLQWEPGRDSSQQWGACKLV